MFNSNSLIYNFASENELAVVLGHFNSDYINTIVTTNLNNRLRIYDGKIPNVVYAFEQDFKSVKDTYPDSVTNIEYCRATTYSNIITLLTNFYGMQYTPIEGSDLYSCTFNLYELLVSNFANNLINFFTNYIIKEKNFLYESLNLNDLKKNKDSSTLYSKKIYKNNKIAAIHANLEMVIDNICVFDISFENILSLIYADKNIINFILSMIQPYDDFFKKHFVSYLYGEYRSIILTAIRLRLQELVSDGVANITN